MLHRPEMPDPCQREVVNSYAIGIVDVGACAVNSSSIERETRMHVGLEHLTTMSRVGGGRRR